MASIRNITIFLIVLAVLAFALFYSKANYAKAEFAGHVVISEIKVSGSGGATDEFVELYNPTDVPVDLADWTLLRKTASVDAEESELTKLFGIIPAYGFYLIAHEDFKNFEGNDVVPDDEYAEQNIALNNTVILRDNEGHIVDLVGMGTSATSEGTTIQNPIDGRSIERKAFSESTAQDMAPGGDHEFLGNSYDSDDNANDFVRHTSPTIPNPQNSSSPVEMPTSETPSPTVTPDPTPTDEPEPTATPTETPDPTPTEEPNPTATPTDAPEATPTEEPTATPTLEPTPTSQPDETEGSVISTFSFPGTIVECRVTWRVVAKNFFFAVFPKISCTRI